jgi:hypothetical protein
LNGSDCLTGMDVRDRTCAPCSSTCPFGYYAFGRCDGTSTFDSRKCMPCGSCLPGQVQVDFCYGNTTIDSTKCRTCNFTTCPPPQILVNQCSGLEIVDRSRCVTCGRLCGQGEYVSKLCSVGSCQLGTATTACSGTLASEAGLSLYDTACTTCATTCPANSYIRVACSGATTNDTVCSPCRQVIFFMCAFFCKKCDTF